MIIKTTKDGSLYTDCSYQHNLAITCGECTTERISKALKRFEQDKNTNELANIVYDTLMQNTQFPQLSLADVDFQELNASHGVIRFEYKGISYRLTLEIDA